MICFKTILIPYQSSTGTFDEGELQNFLETENPNILNYQSQFCMIQGNPCWSIFLAYEKRMQQTLRATNIPNFSSDTIAPTGVAPQSHIPIPKMLKPKEQELYSYLKEWRRVNSNKNNVPAYRYFSDHQMEILVKGQPETIEDLKRISGLNAAQIEKYGKAILDAIKNAPCKKTSLKSATQEKKGQEETKTDSVKEKEIQLLTESAAENLSNPKEENKL